MDPREMREINSRLSPESSSGLAQPVPFFPPGLGDHDLVLPFLPVPHFFAHLSYSTVVSFTAIKLYA